MAALGTPVPVEKQQTMLDPAQTLQAFFLLAASTIVFLNCIPTIREHFITYGPRSTSPAPPSPDTAKKPLSQKPTLENLIEITASLQVPHAYFNHFYTISVASSLFWAIQILTNAKLMRRICSAVHQPTNASMSMEQIELTWALMSIQGIRRQLETAMLAKPSTSKMWFIHYLLGIVFYLAMGIAVWIEGAESLSKTPNTHLAIAYSAPSARTILTLPLFLLASGIQHDCHTYLASLKKYTLPTHLIFNLLICPHYTAECVIYLSLALVAAPEGMWVNRTIFTAFLFVAANLSVTAQGTRAWYEGKFGKEAMGGRWTLVPFVW